MGGQQQSSSASSAASRSASWGICTSSLKVVLGPADAALPPLCLGWSMFLNMLQVQAQACRAGKQAVMKQQISSSALHATSMLVIVSKGVSGLFQAVCISA